MIAIPSVCRSMKRVTITIAVTSAPDHAHEQGLLYREVKPVNILLTHPDASGQRRIFLADFGMHGRWPTRVVLPPPNARVSIGARISLIAPVTIRCFRRRFNQPRLGIEIDGPLACTDSARIDRLSMSKSLDGLAYAREILYANIDDKTTSGREIDQNVVQQK